MTTVPKPSSLSSGLTLKYDAWNRLAEVKDGATVVAKYEYDGRNRRIKKHLDSQSPADPDGVDAYVHYFYNSSWQILETRDTTTESDQPENLQPKYQNVWSARYIDAAILRDENTDQDSLCDDQRLYYLTDANFNVTTLVDTAGDAVEHYLYDPYGKVTIYDGTWSSTRSTSSYNNVTLYTGRELDPESGIMHYRNRYYSAELGRFVSRDPIGYADGYNLFAYVFANPLGGTDPTGEGGWLQGCVCFGAFSMFLNAYNAAAIACSVALFPSGPTEVVERPACLAAAAIAVGLAGVAEEVCGGNPTITKALEDAQKKLEDMVKKKPPKKKK